MTMVTLNTSIKNVQIEESTILPLHFDSVNTPSGSYIIKWNDSENKFEWIENGGITVNEIPTGTKNGVNTTFTLSAEPIDGTEQVYLNGLLQEPGSSNDYTISGDTITFSEAPLSDDIILVTYVTAQAFGYEEYTTPSMPGYGYVSGGNSTTSVVERFAFPFDSGSAELVGNLSGSRYSLAGCNGTEYFFVIGGYDSLNDVSIIDRAQFTFDSGTMVHVGDLDVNKSSLAASNSSIAGYVFGGEDSFGVYSSINKIIFPFDSGTANSIGNLLYESSSIGAYNSSNYGYAVGGSSDSGDPISSISRILYPFTGGTSTNVGNLNYSGWATAGCNSSQYGYNLGIFTGGSRLSVIERATFPFDSGTTTHVGNLTGTRSSVAANNSSSYGYASSGLQPVFTFLSNVDRIQFPFDSGTSSHIGNLTSTKYSAVGTDNTDFISIFV